MRVDGAGPSDAPAHGSNPDVEGSAVTSTTYLPDERRDLRCAAEHLGIELRDVVAAVVRKQLPLAPEHPGRPGVWLVSVGELEMWARRCRRDRELTRRPYRVGRSER